MQKEQYKKSIKILFLRKILRRQQNQNTIRIFSKFGIGVIKYEICSNLVVPQYSIISTMIKNAKTQIKYSTKNNKFQQQKLEIETFESHYSYVEQFTEEALLISGNSQVNVKRFTIYSNKILENCLMQFSRFFHRTIFNKKDVICIISGVYNQLFQKKDRKECESFNVRSKKFEILNPISTPVGIFGCDQLDFNIYIFGGFSFQQGQCLDKIQIYDSVGNKWSDFDGALQQKATVSAITMPQFESFLVYGNGSQIET